MNRFVIVWPAFALWVLKAQDPVAVLPKNYHPEFENAQVRVLRTHYDAREKLPVHDHSQLPTVYVYLSDSGPVRFRHVEENAFVLTRPPLKMGTFRISPGRIEKHDVENLGDTATDFLRVELKQLPLGFQSGSFRGNKPLDLTKSGRTVVFSSPHLSLERIVCRDHQAAKVDHTDIHSLLIAFSPALLRGPAGIVTSLESGEVSWQDSNQTVSVDNVDGSVAHVLRVMLPSRPASQ